MPVFDRFRAASPGRQMQIIAAGVCLIGMVLAGFWYVALRTVYQPLFSGLRTVDAATITAELDQKKIPYRLADRDTAILVPADMVAKTRLDVMSGDVPLKGTVGFELFDKSDMGLTDFAQKIKYQRALQGELERTIMTLDGVDMVRVHLSFGEDRLFRDDRVTPKASVTIRMTKGVTLSGSEAHGIKRLIAAAVPKLEAANVVILNEFGQIVGGTDQAAPPAASRSPMEEEARGIGEYYEALIRAALAREKFSDDTAVSVTADMAPDTDEASGTVDLPRWNPATRDFPLSIVLSPLVPIAPQEQKSILALVTQAIASGTAQPDAIHFGAIPKSQTESSAAPAPIPPHRKVRPPVSAPPAQDAGHDFLMALGSALILALLVIAGFGMLFRRLRGPRRLSKQGCADFAAKLRNILEEGDSHAVSGS